MSEVQTIKAEQKNIRISPRKIRLIVKAVKKMQPEEALDYLKFIPKSGSLALAKTIKQALANATNNLKLNAKNLIFDKIEVQAGPTHKRWRSVSRGRAHSIFKRTSHIRVILKSIKLKAPASAKATAGRESIKLASRKGDKRGTKS